MTVEIIDQPPSKAADRRPAWALVTDYVDQLRLANAHLTLGVGEDVIPIVLSDMRDRDAIIRQRYGTPGNGRQHLVDAYQKSLDACVHFMNALDDHGIGLTTSLTEDAFPDKAYRWYLYDVQQLCTAQIRTSIHLRAIMEERMRRVAASANKQG